MNKKTDKKARATLGNLLREFQRENTRGFKELGELQKQTDRRLRELCRTLDKTNGNFDKEWGEFMESLVEGDLVNLLGRRNIRVLMVLSRLVFYNKDKTPRGKFHLLAVNNKKIVAVEAKTILFKKSVDDFLKKMKIFKRIFPMYRDRKVYGALACRGDVENACEYSMDKGFFVIRAPRGKSRVSIIANGKDFKPREF